MVFSSVIFLFYFLPSAILIYYITPGKLKNIVLLLFSLFFYWWGQPDYLTLLLCSIMLNWLTGLIIDKVTSHPLRTLVLVLALIINVALLGVFKYADYLITTFNGLTHSNVDLLNLVLPIGISFFTFQGMSYIIDIYRNECKAFVNPLNTALYIALFPQLIAGPIVKYNEIYSQINSRTHSINQFSTGIKRFIAGLSKKVLIANILASTADDIFDNFTNGIDCPTAWIGIICYTFQIYYDFSGYSDMAIGLGHMFGFSFAENFNYPYISTSITEFWRRWHISLSTWFKNYIYIPLGGSRHGIRAFNLFVTFLITGIWHGASDNFVLWGIWYWIFLIIEKPFLNKRIYKLIPSFFKWAFAMLIVILGWVLFRSPDLPFALDYAKTLFGIGAMSPSQVHFSYAYYIDNKLIFTLLASILCGIPVWKKLYNKFTPSPVISYIEIPFIMSLLILCIIFIVNNVYNPFIYFQF